MPASAPALASAPLALLVVSPDPAVAAALAPDRLPFSASLRVCPDAPAADLALAEAPADLLVIDDALAGEPGLMFLARRIHDRPWTRGVLLCAPLEPDLFIRLLNEVRPVFCLLAPWRPDELRRLVARAAAEASAARAAHRAARPQRLLAAWSVVLPRLTLVALLTFLTTFLAGLLALSCLYLLKTLFGIDLVNDAHLSDLWR